MGSFSAVFYDAAQEAFAANQSKCITISPRIMPKFAPDKFIEKSQLTGRNTARCDTCTITAMTNFFLSVATVVILKC
ncbi:hypothetical protein [Mixta mediterraneensis]|uniref:hypothetical protein n=1 Tax=Mixta mediterraneensis TaxID=2758443 RepID=UPI00187594EF|nr:hypothetical protein [Mixta mediterraneensis]MBE5253361.1 hypothetical protein [Mixta mediterraneensis]